MFDTIKRLLKSKDALPDGMKMFIMVVDRKVAETGWREGQAMFNALDELYPKWAEEVRTTERDPYYAMEPDDPRVGAFLAWLQEKFLALDKAIAERNAAPQQNLSWEPVKPGQEQKGDSEDETKDVDSTN